MYTRVALLLHTRKIPQNSNGEDLTAADPCLPQIGQYSLEFCRPSRHFFFDGCG
jgi:hypothetical protein